MLNCVICDDDQGIIKLLESYLKRFCDDTHQEISSVSFSSGYEMLNNYPIDTDLVLLDIGLGEENGIQVAKKLRSIAPEVCIIFITTMAQYALDSYSVRAFGFLPKPVSYSVMSRELTAAIKVIQQKIGHFIIIKDQDRGVQRQINIREVLYVEVQKHTLNFVLVDKVLQTRGSIGAYIDELAPGGFLRCHVSYLVNCRYIKEIEQTELIVSNGDRIPISRNRRKEFMAELTTFLGRLV